MQPEDSWVTSGCYRAKLQRIRFLWKIKSCSLLKCWKMEIVVLAESIPASPFQYAGNCG